MFYLCSHASAIGVNTCFGKVWSFHMITRGVDFLENWIAHNVTESVKESVHGDVASLSIERLKEPLPMQLGLA
jgi:hypothetical protein